ncbi:MAG: hypothetical protein Q9160_006904 [Pyrenula sp. 1 TL-2023]
MRFIPLSSVTAIIIGGVQAADVDNRLQGVTSVTIGASAGYERSALKRREGPTATVTIGPTSEYKVTLSSTPPAPSTPGFTIVPAGSDASNGINVVLAPSIQTSLSKAYQEKCNNKAPTDYNGSPCATAIKAFFAGSEIGLQKRQLDQLALLGVAALGALLSGIAMFIGSSPTYHFSQDKLAQLNKPEDPKVLALIPNPGARPINLDVQLNEDSDTTPTIVAVGSDREIQSSQSLAQTTEQFYVEQRNGGPGCQGPSSKRDIDLTSFQKRQGLLNADVISTCIFALTVAFIQAVGHGPLADWRRLRQGQAQINPVGAGPLVLLDNIRREVQPVQQQLGFNNPQMGALINLAFAESTNRLIKKQHSTTIVRVTEEDLKTEYCPATKFLKCTDSRCKGANGSCSDTSELKECKCEDEDDQKDCFLDGPLPCENCGGDAGGLTCRGIANQKNAFRLCRCLAMDTAAPGPFANAQELASVQNALLNLPKFKKKLAPVPPPVCQNSDRPISYEASMFQQLVTESACSPVFKPKPDDVLYASFAATYRGDQSPNWGVRFVWEDKPGDCQSDCKTIFSTFLSSKKFGESARDALTGGAALRIPAPPKLVSFESLRRESVNANRSSNVTV